MASPRGLVTLMGSGELTATMVEVHKELLGRLGVSPRAVFLDTPAGFQLNVGQIAERAVEYFRRRVGHPLGVASLRRAGDLATYEGEHALGELRHADYVLVGPGSPTYAVRHWQGTAVPEILARRVEEGGCLTAASAAALTVGRLTLPVYEIYKVGEDPRWVPGIDLLGRFGLHLAVVPHWNNAEGGTHDTRFCYAGEARFERLQGLLPEDVAVLGIDEHTACILDLAAWTGEVRGIGRVTIRGGGRERVFPKGARFDLSALGEPLAGHREASPTPAPPASSPSGVGEQEPSDSFWGEVHRLERNFHEALEQRDPRAGVEAVLDLDRLLWAAQRDLAGDTEISQGRETLRELVVLLGEGAASSRGSAAELLPRLLDGLLALREHWRREGCWAEADGLREQLLAVGIRVEDTPEGARWSLSSGRHKP
ncbi:MAG: hypothetical protein SCH98_06040 [Deferrisomatales bacterium]|nr:hypothetical protein [Deferrisomatales bacterium]